MKKDWRETKWSDFSKQQKIWFIALAVTLAALLFAAGFCSANNIDVPDWAALIIVGILWFVVHKFAGLTPWALGGMNSTFDDEDEDDDDDEDNDNDDDDNDDDKD